MGFCMHIDTVKCPNCDPNYVGYPGWPTVPLPWAPFQPINPSAPFVVEDPRVVALEKRVAELEHRLKEMAMNVVYKPNKKKLKK